MAKKAKVAKPRKRKLESEIVDAVSVGSFIGQKVWFFDEYHGFWRAGECYKETPKIAHVRCNSSLYRVERSPNSIKSFDAQVEPWNKSQNLATLFTNQTLPL